MTDCTDAVVSLTAFVRFVTRPGWTFFLVPLDCIFEALDIAMAHELKHEVWNFMLSEDFSQHSDCHIIGLPDGGHADLFWIAASHLFLGPLDDFAHGHSA